MPHTLTAKEQTLQKIFSDEYVFTIPGYQRPYSWDNDQAQELLDDLLSALQISPEQLGDGVPYFLGSIVLIKNETSPEATVVDGQQRLTTLTLLLSAIRATIIDKGVQAGITKRIYEHGDVVSATEASYRLSLRDRDRDFFRQYIQHEDGLAKLIGLNSTLPSAQDRLRANARLFMKGLSSLSESELIRLVQFIITRCYLVTVATPDLDSAYRIFGVLNSRGLDLSATDILKAEIIGGIESGLRETYTKKWEDAEDELGRDEFGDLFSHIRMVYRKAKPQGTLLKEFKEHVLQATEPLKFVDTVLLPMARASAALSDSDYASTMYAELVNEHLRWLNKLEFKDWLPPALAFYVRYSEQPPVMLAFFRDLERLAYSMLARKIGINGRIERFSTLTGTIENGQNLFTEISPLQLSPSEQHDTYSVLNGPLYDTHSARAVALLLLRLDRLLSDGAAVYEHGVVSVEHVMPQQPAPNSQWVAWVSDSKIYQSWIHRLGNLVLLSRKKNSSASNREFSWKKNSYFTKGGVSGFALTTQVLKHSEWGTDIMQAQQDSAMHVFEQHWRLEGRKSKNEIAKELLGELSSNSDGVYFELESAKHCLTATARKSSSSFTILAQSQARLDWTGQPHSYQQLRESLRKCGSLQLSMDGTHLVFTQDVNFVSPSAASATVLGRTDNGRNSWRLKGTTITYAAWQDNLPAEESATEIEPGSE
ncbi:DUF4357 domain-containing protein [Burkholderia ambifaria]|uniref:DUF4357 domain-containing protein n=1 Tax=Burkholderia ambifaria TaxID=152480 RepID=UPI00158C5D20|nr:DUF4357 domain-containing protein [Burkholderia ambifaria]